MRARQERYEKALKQYKPLTGLEPIPLEEYGCPLLNAVGIRTFDIGINLAGDGEVTNQENIDFCVKICKEPVCWED